MIGPSQLGTLRPFSLVGTLGGADWRPPSETALLLLARFLLFLLQVFPPF